MFRARIVVSVMAIVVCVPAVMMTSPAAPASAAIANRLVKQNGFNGEVKSITEPDSNGIQYVGGFFSAFDAWDTGVGAVVNSTTAEVNVTFPKIAGSYATIKAVANDGVGGFYIGGTFTSVDGQAISNAAHINADGSLDTAWNPAPNNTVSALVVSGSTVYLGGSFTTVKGATRNRAAAVDASTAALVAGWDPAPNGVVNTLVVSGSTVYLGGSFTTVKATTRNNVAAVAASTAELSSWNPNLDGTVYSLAVSDSTVYIGGWFSYVNAYATSRKAAAAVDATTGIATSWNPSPDGQVNSLLIIGSTVFMAGGFATVNSSISRNRAAAVNLSTGIANSWDPSPRGTVNTLALWGSRLFLGGDFSSVGGTARNNVAAINSSGGLTSWNPNTNGEVKSIVLSGSNVYMCGSFSTVGGIARAEAAIIGTDGTLRAFKPMNHGGSYTAIMPFGDYVYIATSNLTQHTYSNPGPGGYTGRNEVVSQGRGITKYNATINGQNTSNQGYVASPASVGNLNFSTYTYSVSKLLLSGNVMYFAGNFGMTNGSGRRGIAAFDVTTDQLLDWAPLANEQVNSVAVSGSNVYLGGPFTEIGGTYTNYYKPGSAGAIYEYVTGGTSRKYVAAVDATTGALNSWNPTMDGYVNAIAADSSTLYLGGSFTGIGTGVVTTRNRLAAFSLSTGGLSAWNPNMQGTASTYSWQTNTNTLSFAGENVVVGGSFDSISSSRRNGYAVISKSSGIANSTLLLEAPTSTDAPAVSGAAAANQTLEVSQGSWTGSPTSFSYEWMRSTTAAGTYLPIANATSSTYFLTSSDTDYFIRATVTASNSGGSTAVQTAATAQVMATLPVPSNRSVPVVSNSPVVGNSLSATAGDWNYAPTSYSYQWRRATSGGTYSDITGQTLSTYNVDIGDLGYFIRVMVTARNSAGDSVSVYSVSTTAVVDITPTNSVIPAVTGTAQTGQTLSISNGSWNNRETSYAYQWTRSLTVGGSYSSISGAIHATYVVASSDVGYFIKGTVAGVNSGGTSAYASSIATGQVIDIAPVYAGPPVITGTAQMGQTLNVSNGSWDNRPTSFRYQWKRSDASDGTYANIVDATSSFYNVTVDDVGQFIKAVVTGGNTGGDAGAAAWSAATSAVIDIAPVNSAIPVVTGTAKTGQTLSVSNGSWSNRPMSYRFQWMRSLTVDGSYAAITGATLPTYVVDAGDVGYFIKGSVAAVNTGGIASYSMSMPTVQVIDISPIYVNAPAITGTAQTGQTLSVSNGSWSNRPTSYRYQWQRSTTPGSGYVDIVGAVSSTYLVEATDVGLYVSAVVSSTNSGGDSNRSGMSSATAQVIDVTPTISSIPIVSGTAQTDQTLSVSSGSWNNRAVSYVYQWKRSLTSGGLYSDISSATSATYAVTAADVGYFIKGTVAGVNTGGMGTYETSAATAQVIDLAPTNSQIPVVTGIAQMGQTLSVSTGLWNNRALSYTYQWSRSALVNGNFTSIVGADLSTYVVAAGDVGYFIKGTVAGVNTGGSSIYASSLTTDSVIDIVPVVATISAITGTAQNGQTLSASNGNWDNRPTTFTYQWRRAASASGSYLDISGANSATYVASESDVGYFLKVVVTALNSGGTSTGNTSAATSSVLDIAPVNTSAPIINGTMQVNETLSASRGTWASSPTSYAYQWKRANSASGMYSNIDGENSSSYTVTADDLGKFFRVAVTATNNIGASIPMVSASRGPIIDVIAVNLTLPTVSGTAKNAETLTATTGTWENRPTSYAYQWKRATTATGTYAAISGETDRTYVLTDSDVDKYIKVSVTAINSGGSSAIVTSTTAIGPIADLPLMTAPTVSDLSITRTATGFTFQISNYSSTTAYSLTTTVGSVTLGDTGLATVTGLTAGDSATVTVRVSRTGYRSASVIVVSSTIAPSTTTTTTTIAANSDSRLVTTTTIKSALSPRTNVTSTTIAVVKSVNQTQVSAPPKKNSSLPNVTTTTVPELETAAPGAAAATVDGKVVEAEVTREENKVVASIGGVTAAVGVLNADGSTSGLDTDGNVRIKPGQLFNLAVDGFAAGSTVDVWLFSTPRKLGELITAADGTVTATFAIPSDLKNGKHRLAFVGTGVGGKETTLVVGIVAGAEPKNWSSTRVLIVSPLVMAIFFALLLPGVFRRRKARLA